MMREPPSPRRHDDEAPGVLQGAGAAMVKDFTEPSREGRAFIAS
jgi:hypothetical protein